MSEDEGRPATISFTTTDGVHESIDIRSMGSPETRVLPNFRIMRTGQKVFIRTPVFGKVSVINCFVSAKNVKITPFFQVEAPAALPPAVLPGVVLEGGDSSLVLGFFLAAAASLHLPDNYDEVNSSDED